MSPAGLTTVLTFCLIDLIIFISLDLISLIIQSIGGASASQAAEQNKDAGPGGRIMLYGIVLQMSEFQNLHCAALADLIQLL
jgi:hypothetical protein